MLALLAVSAALAAPLVPPQRQATPIPNGYQQPARCRDAPYHVVDQYGRPAPTRLGDLPNPGALQLLVDRKVDGCRVITVKYGVVAPDQPNPPAQSYRMQPLKPQSSEKARP